MRVHGTEVEGFAAGGVSVFFRCIVGVFFGLVIGDILLLTSIFAIPILVFSQTSTGPALQHLLTHVVRPLCPVCAGAFAALATSIGPVPLRSRVLWSLFAGLIVGVSLRFLVPITACIVVGLPLACRYFLHPGRPLTAFFAELLQFAVRGLVGALIPVALCSRKHRGEVQKSNAREP